MARTTDELPLWALPLFPLMWIVVLSLISKIGGWSTLAERYRFNRKFDGEKRYFVSARMGLATNYGSCLVVGANEGGMFLSVLIPFRFAHPPLLIPWSDISLYFPKNSLLPSVGFKFSNCPSVTLRLYRGTAVDLIGASKGAIRWPDQAAPAA